MTRNTFRKLGLGLLGAGALAVGMYRVAAPATPERGEPVAATEAKPAVALPVRGVVPVPDSLSFCGEAVPLHRPEVRERMERELIDNTFKSAQTLLILKRAGRWESILKATLAEAGVPADLFYLAVAESELANARSRVGAQGFWQFMPATAPAFGLKVTRDIDERDSPTKAAQAAAAYLAAGYRQHKSWALAAAGYNMGPGRVTTQLREQHASSYYDLALNPETQRYVYRILALKVILENPEAYGFELPATALYQSEPCRVVTIRQTIDDLAVFAESNGSTYQRLRLLNPWLKGTRLVVGRGETYRLYLPDPAGTVQMGQVTE